MSSPANRSAARKRRFRERQKAGVVMLRIPVCEDKFAAAAIRSGRLSEREALRRADIERVAASVLGEWAKQWNASL